MPGVASTQVSVPRLASKERTRTWGTRHQAYALTLRALLEVL